MFRNTYSTNYDLNGICKALGQAPRTWPLCQVNTLKQMLGIYFWTVLDMKVSGADMNDMTDMNAQTDRRE